MFVARETPRLFTFPMSLVAAAVKARQQEMAILAAKPSTRLPPDLGSTLSSTPDRSIGMNMGDVISICAGLASWLMRR